MKIWFDTGSAVQQQNLTSPEHRVANPYALRLPFYPKLKVIGAIVELVAIDVVDILPRQQRTTKRLLHHDTVFIPP